MEGGRFSDINLTFKFTFSSRNRMKAGLLKIIIIKKLRSIAYAL